MEALLHRTGLRALRGMCIRERKILKGHKKAKTAVDTQVDCWCQGADCAKHVNATFGKYLAL